MKEITTNILIIGGGGSGMMAAVSAYNAGEKDVIILEKTGRLGGSIGYVASLGAYESPTLDRLGVKIDLDKVFTHLMDHSHWKTDPFLARRLINNTGKVMKYLESRGLVYKDAVATTDPSMRICHYWPEDNIKSAGPGLLKVLTKDVKEKEIKSYLNADVKKLIKEEDTVKGAIAEIDGEEIRFNAKCVLLAVGNFGRDKEKLEKYWPDYQGETLFNHCLPQMDSSGVNLAYDAGAAVPDELAFWMFGPHHYEWDGELTKVVRHPMALWVNKYGERFCDESLFIRKHTIAANALNRQPGKYCYSIFDEKVMERLRHYSTDDVAVMFPTAIKLDGSGDKDVPDLKDERIEEAIERGVAYKADSIEELAQKMGIDREILVKTVNRYNEFCFNRYDKDLLKDPKYLSPITSAPYYAVKGAQGYDAPMGGILINQNMEVLDKDKRPIPGLYSSGDIANGGTHVSGDACIWPYAIFALTSGLLVGQDMAVVCSGQ